MNLAYKRPISRAVASKPRDAPATDRYPPVIGPAHRYRSSRARCGPSTGFGHDRTGTTHTGRSGCASGDHGELPHRRRMGGRHAGHRVPSCSRPRERRGSEPTARAVTRTCLLDGATLGNLLSRQGPTRNPDTRSARSGSVAASGQPCRPGSRKTGQAALRAVTPVTHRQRFVDPDEPNQPPKAS